MALQPGSAAAHRMLGEVLMRDGYDLEATEKSVPHLFRAAEAALAEAVRLDPGDAGTWLKLAETRLSAARHAGSLGPEADALVAAAALAVERARGLDLDSDGLHGLLASLHLKWAQLAHVRGDAGPQLDAAEVELGKVPRGEGQGPWRDESKLWLFRAEVAATRGDAGQALAAIDRAEDAATRSIGKDVLGPEVRRQRGRVRYARATLLESQGKTTQARVEYAGAVSDFFEAFSLRPGIRAEIEAPMREAIRKTAGLSELPLMKR